MRGLRIVALAALAAAIAVPAWGQGLPRAQKPEEVGLSSERLKRLGEAMREGVEKGDVPGAVALIARNGKVAYLEGFGFRDREAKAPMKPDAIFRIASMTKPMVSLAIMMLAEEGKLSIAYPVSRYLPAFKEAKVGVEKKKDDGSIELELVAPQREMTVQDLLRHTSGLTYGVFGNSRVDKMYLEASLFDRNQTNEQFVAKLAKLPLKHQPGTIWEYSVATDVLGRIVEVVSGQPLDQFIAERIAKPLRMADSGFWVEAAKKDRIAEPQNDPKTGKRPSMRDVTEKPTFMSGGGGMVSTAADYARFSQLWLNGGQLDGVRLVSRKTVELMTSDHLPPGIRVSPGASLNPNSLAPTPERALGFGLGFAVRLGTGRSPMYGSTGEFFWAGAGGTNFVIDPKEKLIAVLMLQAPSQLNPYRNLMRQLAYQALTD